MIRRIALPLVVLVLGLVVDLVGFATSSSTLAATESEPISYAASGRYEGDDAFLLLVVETRFSSEGEATERVFDCIADVALTIDDGAGTTRLGTGLCGEGEAGVHFEIVGRAHPDGVEAEIRLDYAGVETALPLETELVPSGLGADFSGRSERVGDRELAFNGTFAARRR